MLPGRAVVALWSQIGAISVHFASEFVPGMGERRRTTRDFPWHVWVQHRLVARGRPSGESESGEGSSPRGATRRRGSGPRSRPTLATSETLRRQARRFSLCADDADDALQRALEILLRKAPTTDPRELIRWTQTVVKHEALAVRRERERLLGGPPATAPPKTRSTGSR